MFAPPVDSHALCALLLGDAPTLGGLTRSRTQRIDRLVTSAALLTVAMTAESPTNHGSMKVRVKATMRAPPVCRTLMKVKTAFAATKSKTKACASTTSHMKGHPATATESPALSTSKKAARIRRLERADTRMEKYGHHRPEASSDPTHGGKSAVEFTVPVAMEEMYLLHSTEIEGISKTGYTDETVILTSKECWNTESSSHRYGKPARAPAATHAIPPATATLGKTSTRKYNDIASRQRILPPLPDVQ